MNKNRNQNIIQLFKVSWNRALHSSATLVVWANPFVYKSTGCSHFMLEPTSWSLEPRLKIKGGRSSQSPMSAKVLGALNVRSNDNSIARVNCSNSEISRILFELQNTTPRLQIQIWHTCAFIYSLLNLNISLNCTNQSPTCGIHHECPILV